MTTTMPTYSALTPEVAATLWRLGFDAGWDARGRAKAHRLPTEPGETAEVIDICGLMCGRESVVPFDDLRVGDRVTATAPGGRQYQGVIGKRTASAVWFGPGSVPIGDGAGYTFNVSR